MKPMTCLGYCLCLLFGVGVALNSQAADPRASGAAASQGSGGGEQGALYRPPSRGAPVVRVGAGSRGVNDGEKVPILMALVPEHLALSASEQPVLYWFISSPHPGDVQVSISREDRVDPVFETNLGPAVAAGFHRLDLADQGVTLEPGIEYSWFVTLILNPDVRSKDHPMGGAIVVEPRGAEVKGEMQGETALDQAVELAHAGYWHDAIDALGRAIEAHPNDGELREIRAKMLDQVGLSEAAEYDRRGR